MFIAFVMKPQAEIDWIQTFQTEAEADAFGIEESSYTELDPETDDPDHWEHYDPPVVIVFETDDPDAFDNGKYNQPSHRHLSTRKQISMYRSVYLGH